MAKKRKLGDISWSSELLIEPIWGPKTLKKKKKIVSYTLYFEKTCPDNWINAFYLSLKSTSLKRSEYFFCQKISTWLRNCEFSNLCKFVGLPTTKDIKDERVFWKKNYAIKVSLTKTVACVASVSNRVIARKLGRKQKLVVPSFPSPSPVIQFFFLLLSRLSRRTSRGNACYAGY